MTEIFGMPLEMAAEAVMTHLVLTFGLFHLLRVKEKAKGYALIWMLSLCLCDVVIAYFLYHVDIYSEMVYRSVKWIVLSLLFFSCNCVFEGNAWKIAGAMFLGDIFAGVPGFLRLLTCQVFRISVSGAETGEYPWSLKLLYLFYAVLLYLIVRGWMSRYERSDGSFGLVSKLMILVYAVPVLSSSFAGILQMKTDTSQIYYGGTMAMVPLEMLICLFAVIMERNRRLRMENRSLLLQTSLFAEHEQVLLEQQDMINSLADWLEETGLSVPSAGLVTKRRMRMKQASYCTSGMVNLALCNKVGQCEEQGITVNVDMDHVSLPKGLKEIDLLTILYNLFDNAARAAGECEKERRYISLQMHAEENRLELAMENGKDKEAEVHRKGGGQGLGIIEGTVKKYHGEMRHGGEADRYTVQLCLRFS